MKKPPAKGRGFCTDWSPRRAGVLGGSRTHGLSLRSTALPFCVLLYFLYSFFSFHIMPYGGYT